MLIKQHQSNTISLSSVIGLEKGAVCLTRRVEVKLSINTLRPRPHVSDPFLNPQLFLSGYGSHPHVSCESGMRIRNFLNPLSRVQIFEYGMNPELCGRQIRIFFLSGDVTRSSPVIYRDRYSKMQTSRALRRIALLPIFPKEARVLE